MVTFLYFNDGYSIEYRIQTQKIALIYLDVADSNIYLYCKDNLLYSRVERRNELYLIFKP